MDGLIRQGDIMLVPVTDKYTIGMVRKSVKQRKRTGEGLIVAEGEATGHHHRVRTKGVRLVEVGGTLYLQGPESKLEHEEHETLTVPKGTHRIVQQREHAPSVPTRQTYVRD
jgi:hypothetical protein